MSQIAGAGQLADTAKEARMNWLARILQFIDTFNEWAGRLVSWLCLVLIAVILYEVVARYVFNAPTTWGVEFATFVFAVMWLFAGGYVMKHDAHVRVDIFYNRASPRGRAILSIITAPLMFLMLGTVIFITLKYGLHAVSIGERSSSDWAPPIYIMKMVIPFGAAVFLSEVFFKVVGHVHTAVKGSDFIESKKASWGLTLAVVIPALGILALLYVLIFHRGIIPDPGVELSAGMVAILLFGLAIVLMATGLPVVFSMGSIAYILIFLINGAAGLGIIASRTWAAITMFELTCIPMYVFMGLMLEYSGIANQLYHMMHQWSGRMRGGLAAGTVGICMLMAAMTGTSAAATLTMGVTALPEMLKRSYNKSIALGCIMAGGALGPLIPPSIVMIFYAIVAQQSVGKLFIGGIIPGILLGGFFIVYILVRSWLQPQMAPALPPEERGSWKEKFISLRKTILPIFIIFLVLGSIFFGIATPTEAAAVGAFGTIISALVNRTFNRKSLRDTALGTVRISSMGLWIMVGTYTIQTIVFSVGATQYIQDILLSLPGGEWGAIISMQVLWFILGALIDPISILLITGPIFCPIVQGFGFDMVWFGIVFVLNMEMSYLTPPYGINLFYMKGIVPKGITMGDVYRSIGPFVALQAIALIVVMVFP